MNEVEVTLAIRELIDKLTQEAESDYLAQEAIYTVAKNNLHDSTIRRNAVRKKCSKLQKLITASMAQAVDEATELQDAWDIKSDSEMKEAFKKAYDGVIPPKDEETT